MKKIIFSGSIILSLFYFTACQKQDIVTPPLTKIDMPGTSGGTASFSLAATNNNCLHTNAGGSFSKGIPLTTKNTLLVNVTVDTIGTYTIATANINGILFKASGIFTEKGNQTILLQGQGTPVDTGTFNYIPGADGCSIAITFTTGGALSNDAIFALTGAPDSCLTPLIMGDYQKGTPLNKADSIVLKVTVGKPGAYSISTNANNGMLFYANGTFTGNGLASITLYGIGSPAAAGIFNFTPGPNGCLFTIAVK